MRDRLSFYVPGTSPVHTWNPLTKLTLVFTLIIVAFSAPGYWTPSLLFVLAVVPLGFLAGLGGMLLRTIAQMLLPFFSFLFVMQSLFYPGGETELFRLWIFSVKLEGVQFGFLTISRLLMIVSSFMILLLTTHPSTLMNDLTRRGLPAAIAYIVTATLQILPQMQTKANAIMQAQQARGLEIEGSLWRRVGALLPMAGPLVFGSLVDVEERAIAIEACAFNAPRRKTALNTLPDPPVERLARWIMLAIMLISLVNAAWLSFSSRM